MKKPEGGQSSIKKENNQGNPKNNLLFSMIIFLSNKRRKDTFEVKNENTHQTNFQRKRMENEIE